MSLYQPEDRCFFIVDSLGRAYISELAEHLQTCASCQGFFNSAYRYYLELHTQNAPPFFEGWDIFNKTLAFEELPAGIGRDSFLSAWNLAAARKIEQTEFRFVRLFERLIDGGWHSQCATTALLTIQNILLKLIAQNGPLEMRQKYLNQLLYVYRTLRDYLGPEDFALLTSLKTEEELNKILQGWQKAALPELSLATQTIIVAG